MISGRASKRHTDGELDYSHRGPSQAYPSLPFSLFPHPCLPASCLQPASQAAISVSVCNRFLLGKTLLLPRFLFSHRVGLCAGNANITLKQLNPSPIIVVSIHQCYHPPCQCTHVTSRAPQSPTPTAESPAAFSAQHLISPRLLSTHINLRDLRG